MRHVSLDDKYTVEAGRVFLTGMQALTLLPMLQRRHELAALPLTIRGFGHVKQKSALATRRKRDELRVVLGA